MAGEDWRGLEKAVARLMAHSGWQNVVLVGESGDQGADVIGTRSEGVSATTFVTQVKAVTAANMVGPDAVDQVLGAMASYGSQVGVVATNGVFNKATEARARQLCSQGFRIKLWNGAFLRQLFEGCPSGHAFKKTPRKYQKTIIEQSPTSVSRGSQRQHFVLATGLGKTLIAAEILMELFRQGRRRFLVLCHMKDLADQLEISFWSQMPKELPTWTFYEGEQPVFRDGVNFGLFQSLASYVHAIEPGTFDAVFVDEAHHAPAHTYRRCLEHLRPEFMLGMTATPWHKEEGGIESLFGERIGEISLSQGLAMGYLAQVDYSVFCDNIDWAALSGMTGHKFSVSDLNKRLFIPQRDEVIAKNIADECQNLVHPKVIIFCPSVEHGRRFANVLTAAGISCKDLSGVSKVERYKRMLEFSTGRLKALTAVDVLNEGIDLPMVNVVVFLRCTHSRRVFVQQLGRGLRLVDGKTKVRAMDFVADLRRLAEVVTLDKEYKEHSRTGEIYELNFGKSEIRFTNERVRSFVEEWAEDVRSISELGDKTIIDFPKS